MSNLTIGEVNLPEEYEALIELWQSAGPGISLSRSDELPELMMKYNAAPDLFLVARQDNKLVGCVIGGFDGRRGLVYHLAVLPGLQQGGLGTKLMQSVEERLKQKGCKKAYLLVKRGNPALDDFYSKRDWQPMDDIRLFGKNLA